MMECTDGEELLMDPDQAPPLNGPLNAEPGDDLQEPMGEFLEPQAEYNEEEEERKYYRRKRLGVVKNVVACSVGALIVYSVYMGLLQMQLILHYDTTYREVKYSSLSLENIDRKMLMGINVTPIISLLYTPVLIRFLGTKWMIFLSSGIYSIFVSTNYWESYYTLVPSAVAIGVVIVPFWASLGNYITRMAQQYYEFVNYKQEDVQEQRKLPRGACHRYIIIFHTIFYMTVNLSFTFSQLPMVLVLNELLLKRSHILSNVKQCGADVSGVIPGFNNTVLSKLPHSMVLIKVESVLMGFAFLSMIIFLGLCGAAYRPTEEIDLRSIGWGNIFQLPFKHLRDYRLRFLCPFFIYSGFESLFIVTGFSLSYGVCVLGLDRLWLLLVTFGVSASVCSLLSLSLLRLPRWACLVGGASVHGVLLVMLMAFSPKPQDMQYEAALLVIAALWGLGTALHRTGLSVVLAMLYGEEKERLDFVFTILHWWQAIGIFMVYLWSNFPMRAKLSILLVLLLLSSYCYLLMERRLAHKVVYRIPRIPRPRHKVKGYRYLEEDNSDESDSGRSSDEEQQEEEEEQREEEQREEEQREEEERGQRGEEQREERGEEQQEEEEEQRGEEQREERGEKQRGERE